MGEARLSEHGWGGLSDLYEPYLLQKEMSGKFGIGWALVARMLQPRRFLLTAERVRCGSMAQCLFAS